MKKFSKLVAVVLAIAVIICPMMSVVSHATTTGGYKIEAIDANNLKLTINSTDGFIAYHATVGFNSDTAFQSSYTDADATTGYKNGLKVISYTLKTAQQNPNNKPAISAEASGNSLNVIVMPSDINNLDLCTEIVIGIRVADGTTASLTKIQAADNGADVTADPTLLSFPAAGSDGVIDSTAQDYIASNATTNAHTHSFTQQTQTAAYLRTDPTCTADATYWYSCATCGLASSTEYFTATGTKIAHTPNHTKTFAKDPATCTTDATYYDECSECHQQLDTFWTENNTALGHNMTHHDSVSSTCKVQGNIEYYSCSRCGKFFAEESGATELTAEQIKRDLAAHTPATAVKENEVAATCNTAGSYDSVVYCSVCGAKISSEKVDVPATGKHTAGEPVVENNVPATCTAQGHYDTVVYCSVCGEEISRETVNVPTIAHTVVEDPAVAATCTATGLTAGSHCSVCNTVLEAQTVVPALGHDFVTYTSNGNGTHTAKCTRCDATDTQDCNTNGNDGACSVCGYKATPTEPVVDPNLANIIVSQRASVDNKIGIFFSIQFKNPNKSGYEWSFDDFNFIVSKKLLDSKTYSYTGETQEEVFSTSRYDQAFSSVKAYRFTYNKVGLYEMGSELTYTVKLFTGGVCTAQYTWEPTSLTEALTNYYLQQGAGTTLRNALADILNLGEACRQYFGNEKSTNAGNNTLSNMSPLNASVSAEDGCKDYGSLSIVEGQRDAAFSSVKLSLADAPSLYYTFRDASFKDVSTVTFTVSFTSMNTTLGDSGAVQQEFAATELPEAYTKYAAKTGGYNFSFADAPLYDVDKVITLVVSNGVTSYTHQYSVLSLLAEQLPTATTLAAGVYEAVARFNVSCQAQFAGNW